MTDQSPGPSPVVPRWERRQRRREATVRLVVIAVLVVALGGATAYALTAGPGRPTHAAAGGTGSASPPTARSTDTTGPTTVPPTTTTTTVPPTTTSTTVDPGTLPQTNQLPTTDNPVFAANMAALWDGIVSDDVQTALPAFFPQGAYVQLKAIYGASEDYADRLVGDYGLDITAAHQVLGADPGAAQFVGVDADAAYAHWVPPGVCDNRDGYYEMPNARVVYTVGGQTSSFGIASLISWRGEWYVVHLGAILRSGSGGEVDDPQAGPGAPAYSGTC